MIYFHRSACARLGTKGLVVKPAPLAITRIIWVTANNAHAMVMTANWTAAAKSSATANHHTLEMTALPSVSFDFYYTPQSLKVLSP